MIQLFPEHLEQIRAEALGSHPEEAVWLITKDGKCRQVENIHEDPVNYFDVSTKDVRSAKKRGLLAVVHSHTNGRHYPSHQDMQFQINTSVPWGLLTCDGVDSSAIVWWGSRAPDHIEPLDKRTFRHGISDCYALIRDYYLLHFGIDLPEFAREWEWWKQSEDLLRNGFESAGFRRISQSEAKPGDVWLASLMSEKITHCGVLLDNDLTYHQPGAGRPVDESKKAAIQPIYRYIPHITLWVRHKDRD